MTSHVTLSKTNGTPLLFKCLAAGLHAAQRRRVIDSPALDGNELCTAPSYLRCALALPSMAGPVSPRASPEELTRNLHPSPSPSPLTELTTHHPFTLALTLALKSP